jgi:hypothetical protein
MDITRLLPALALAFCSTVSQADTLEQTFEFYAPLGAGSDGSDQIDPYFDPALGTLTQVRVSISVTNELTSNFRDTCGIGNTENECYITGDLGVGFVGDLYSSVIWADTTNYRAWFFDPVTEDPRLFHAKGSEDIYPETAWAQFYTFGDSSTIIWYTFFQDHYSGLPSTTSDSSSASDSGELNISVTFTYTYDPALVVVDSTDWAQPDLFKNLSWNDINAVCPGGICIGELNGYDVTGMIWASTNDVNDLFNHYLSAAGVPAEDLLNGSSITFYGETNSQWAPAFFEDFRATGTWLFGGPGLMGYIYDGGGAGDTNLPLIYDSTSNQNAHDEASTSNNSYTDMSRDVIWDLTGAFLYHADSDNDMICDKNIDVSGVCTAGPAGGDNCRTISNNDQADIDLDLTGDLCDNCPVDSNANQADADADGIGNICDPDWVPLGGGC